MKQIVVIGAGFGGLQATVELDRLFRQSPDVRILLICDQNYFLFTPLLPQIASSYIDPRHIVQTIRDIRGQRGFRFLRDTVRAVHVNQRRMELTRGSIDYDSLVVALGSCTEYFNVSGAREYSLDFKTLEDAVRLREQILDFCEHADHTSDAAERRRLLTFAVVGGGYTGVELISEMRDLLLGYIARHYRGIPREEIRLVLLEAAADVLSGVHPKLRHHALRRLKSEGIEIRRNARVTRVSNSELELNGREILRAGTIVWAAGVRAHPLVEGLPGPHDKIGRAIVNEHLQLEGHPEVFIAGDSSAALPALEAPRVAPVAIVQGRLAARNLAHRERGEPLEDYRYAFQGMLVSLGMNDAVVNIGGLRIHGYFAWLLWNAVHLFKLVGLKKQLQVAVDWMFGSVFPRDGAIVRRLRDCRLCGPPSK